MPSRLERTQLALPCHALPCLGLSCLGLAWLVSHIEDCCLSHQNAALDHITSRRLSSYLTSPYTHKGSHRLSRSDTTITSNSLPV